MIVKVQKALAGNPNFSFMIEHAAKDTDHKRPRTGCDHGKSCQTILHSINRRRHRSSVDKSAGPG